MSFSLTEYERNIEVRLALLPRWKKVAFALYCCERLFHEFAIEVARHAEDFFDQMQDFLMKLKYFCERRGEFLAPITLANVNEHEWEFTETTDPHQRLMDFGVTELLNCVVNAFDVYTNDSAEAAAAAAVNLINRYDFEIQMILEIEESFDHDVMRFVLADIEGYILKLSMEYDGPGST